MQARTCQINFVTTAPILQRVKAQTATQVGEHKA